MNEAIYIAGIGASAGGLEAITQLVRYLRPELPCAFVILQHHSPNHRSMMVEILSRETQLAVKEAEDGELPLSGVIYVVPSNSNAFIRERRIHLVAATPEVVPKPSINHFLVSLAAEEAESAIGIVLSGTGSDGMAGLRAIQEAGGYTFAQKPETAKYDGMPRSAIEAGVVDHILAPEEIASRLPALIESALTVREAGFKPEFLDRLLGMVKSRLNSDFSGYKIGTLTRRIRRREVATGCSDLGAYLQWVESHPEELDRLAKDILISVTAFFRDREAFEALEEVVRRICKEKSPGSEIRVWVAGCASGEEAYSIAMLFANCLGEKISEYRIQIFATDLDEDALNVARRGVYPSSAMHEVPQRDLDRYFRPVDQAFEARKILRDMIVFARHNLISDPPFVRIDLVSCRNVLIYLESPVQSRILRIFHFSLQKDGFLFLGRSESTSQAEQLFSPVNRRERVFRKSGEKTAIEVPLPVPHRQTVAQQRVQKVNLLLDGLVNHLDVTAALCDPAGNLLHTAGRVGDFLVFPQGTTRTGIADVVIPELRGELLTLIHRYGQQGKPQNGRKRKRGNEFVRIAIVPAGQEMLVLFLPEAATSQEAEKSAEANSSQLEDELAMTREHLQSIVEELATSNEEIQALNEEALASNEELQATNEELETSNEELQATNEELTSLNEELSVKSAELARLYGDYAHLYNSLEFPVMVFNRNLLMERYNLAAAKRFDFHPSSLLRHISLLKLPPALNFLEETLRKSLERADHEEQTVEIDEKILRIYVTPGIEPNEDAGSIVVSCVDVTDLVKAKDELSQSEQRLTAIMQNTSMLYAMMDIAGNFLYLNQRFLNYFGMEEAEYVGRNVFSFLPGDIAASLWTKDMEGLRNAHPVNHVLVVGKDGEDTRWLHSTHQKITDGDGKPVALIMQAEDITDRKIAEDQMRITAKIYSNAGEGILVTDRKLSIQTVNPAFTKITGYSIEEAQGKHVGTLLKSGRHSNDFYAKMWHDIDRYGIWQGEIWNKRKNGEIYPEWLTINRIQGNDGEVEHYIAVFSDISEIKNSHNKAEYLATHDVLTGLANRNLFQDRLKHSLAIARRRNGRVALLFIDLDNFKTINDTLGHDVGDELLRQAARRLQEIVRDVDTVSRLGGDEFTVILSDCDAMTADAVGRRIVDDLSASFEIQNRNLFVSASVGIAFFPDNGEDSQTLIKAADTAMYRAKEGGRNRIEFFVPEMHVRLMKRAALESALRLAIDERRLRLVYQPKYWIHEEVSLYGAEALVRWEHPELGEISPGEFIPVAESSGLILQLGIEVERILFEQISTWMTMGLNVPKIALNISPKSMRESGVARRIVEALQRHEIPSDLVQVEITEGALLETGPAVVANTLELDQSGISISIDDFGTGYSSLSYLKRLPLAELKIDKSFIDGLGTDTGDEAISTAILGLGKALELSVVAEGVENARQLEWLRNHGCTVAQGFYFSRPLESASFEDLLFGQNG